jgi:hypothetical protein
VFSARNAPRVNVNSVNFAVNRGVAVPRNINVVSVSAFPALIDTFPSFRDNSFFIVEDEIVFLDRDRRVADVVPVGPRARFSRNFSGSSAGNGSAAALNLSQSEIREVQQVLIEQGFLTGEADGVLSTRTQEALVSFQRKQGIETSGRIDSRTVASLGLSNKIGQQSSQTTSGSQSSTVGQSQGSRQNTTGQGSGQANGQGSSQSNAPMNQSTTGQAGGGAQQPSAQQQPPAQQNQQPAQQNTQAAPQNNQSTVGQSGNQPPANQNQNTQSGQSGQGNNPPPATSGQGNNAPPPAQNSGQNQGR